MRLLVRGGHVITLDDAREIVQTDVAIVGDRIAGLGPVEVLVAEHGPPEETLDVAGRYVLPGFVNAHTHAFQSAFRGLGDGMLIGEWQRRVTHPAYTFMSAEDAYWFTLVGCIEMVRSGVTTAVNFQAFPNDVEACRLAARAFGETGLRGLLVKSFYGVNARAGLLATRESVMADIQHVFEELHGSYDGRVRFCVGPPGARNAPGDWLQEAHAIASRHGSGVHVHVAEHQPDTVTLNEQLGMTEIEHYERLGVVDERFQAAHGIWITPSDTETLARRGGNVAHCPVSNMILGNGVADVPGMHAAGVNVALGSDGPATNNNQDMIAVMKAASLLQKVTHQDPTLMLPGRVLEMATRDGARAAYLDAGVVEPGRLADLIVVDLSGAHNQPLHRPVSALVHSATMTDVESVIVGGRVVMRERTLPGVDEAGILEEARRRVVALLERSGQTADLAARWPLA